MKLRSLVLLLLAWPITATIREYANCTVIVESTDNVTILTFTQLGVGLLLIAYSLSPCFKSGATTIRDDDKKHDLDGDLDDPSRARAV